MTAQVLAVQQVNWQLEDYAHFRKCGEITASPDIQCIGLNCIFCPGICLQIEVFMQHIREHHSQDIIGMYLTANKKGDQATQTELMVVSTASDNNNVNNPKAINWNENAVEISNNATTTIATTNAVAAAAAASVTIGFNVEVDLGVQVAEVDMQPEAPQEEVGLVYIMESHALEGELVEEIVDPFVVGNGEWSEYEKEKTTENNNDPMEEEDSSNEPTSTTKPNTRSRRAKFIAMNKLAPSKEIIFYLLEAYKNNEKLWNPKCRQYKYNANRSIFNELSAPLSRDMNCTLNGTDISEILKRLRSRYLRELSKLKENKKYKPVFPYFEKMDFLRDTVENKRAIREGRDDSDEAESEASSTEVVSLKERRQVLSHLLIAFKREEKLWNTEHPNYIKIKLSEHYHDISNQLLEQMNMRLTSEECRSEIENMLTRYRQELRILKERETYKPRLWCFEEMGFLRKVCEQHKLNRGKRRVPLDGNTKTKLLKAKAINFESIEDNLKFIDLYRKHTALWDVDHPDFRSVLYRNEALNKLLEECNSLFDEKYTMDELQKTIVQTRKAFSVEKQKLLSDACSRTTSSCPLYAKLTEFLDVNLGPFRCEVCNDLIKTSDQYKVHKAEHDGTQPFICVLCGKGFQISGNLTVHIRRHKRDYPYVCEVCGKKFATSTEMAIHKRSHTGERPYTCDLCGKTFKTWSFFDIHRRTHLNQSTFHCPICDKGFYEKGRYTDHMNRHLNIRKHECKECDKTFTTDANLKKHNELHLPVMKYKCTACGKRFAQFASLRWHKRKSHTQYEQ